MLTGIIKKIKSAPKDPGIYIFYKNAAPLYVGKASNLKNRLQNYLKITDLKTEALHREANRLKIFPLRSNIEALIVESKLIKELKPKYNVLWRDDKNYFYVAITKDKFPRIFITHQPKVNGQWSNVKSNYVGPFTDGRALKVVLRLLRRYFPYCTCKPHLRLCLNSQINNCPGYCCQKNNQPQTNHNKQQIKNYKKNITKIKNILTGKDKKFLHKLKDPYELLVLEKIWEHEPYLEKSKMDNVKSNMSHFPFNIQLNKVECYDNSHLSGKEAVGAMTAWKKENGLWVADKNSWRKFKIRGNYTENDPKMMNEIVGRRMNHPEWHYPDLMIIDGGITQFRAAKRALQKSNVKGQRSNVIKVISFAKPQELVFGLEKSPVPISRLLSEFQNLIKTTIQNTHNFVIRYHRKIRENRI